MRAALALALCLLPVAVSAAPLDQAYTFIDRMIDLHASGDTLRLAQSYVPTATFDNGDVSYTYDDDVLIVALLAAGDKTRARLLGDSLIYAQAHDAASDGRVRDAYHSDPFLKHDGTVNVASRSSYTGNLAWTGIAWIQLYHATKDTKYRDAALAVAGFIQTNMNDTRGHGGYIGGFTSSGAPLTWKSSEHNIDLYGFFTMLAQATHDPVWKTRAKHALGFVKSMWNRRGGFYFIGTGTDGVTINHGDPTPEDVQTWSFLSTHLAARQGSVDWALSNLSATEGAFDGLAFEQHDRSGVWFEGTAHAAAALFARALPGDADKAEGLITDIEIGQAGAPNADGNGIDAASKDGLKTDDNGDAYYASLHTGATGWYCIAKQAANPFKFLKR